MTSLRNLLLFIVVILTLSFTISKEVSKNLDKSKIAPGEIAPEATFYNQNNKQVQLTDFKGKITYINLWTTWSEPSKTELSHFEKLHEKYGNQVNFVNVSLDYQRDLEKWKTEVAENNLKSIQLIAKDGWNSDFVKSFNVLKIPRAILIDKEGKILNAFAPKASEQKIEEILSEI